MLPSNDRVLARVPRRLRERFVEKLTPKLHNAFTGVQPRPGSDLQESAFPEMLAAACATCRGDCCTGGTDHAHLDSDSLARARDARSWENAEEALAAYVAFIPRQHYRASCLYHTPAGCALPRDMRGDVCNRHLCGALAQLERRARAGEGPEFLAVASGWAEPRRAALIGPAGSVSPSP